MLFLKGYRDIREFYFIKALKYFMVLGLFEQNGSERLAFSLSV
jgi:hypothetical protein